MRGQNEQRAFENTNRVAWVTGGTEAIGGAVAELLVARGVRVMLGYGANRERALAQAEQLQRTYRIEVLPIQSDMRRLNCLII